MVPYIDLHCDTLKWAWINKQRDIRHLPEAMVDIVRLKKGGCMAQFFAMFLMPPERMKQYAAVSDDQYIAALCEIFRNSLGAELAQAKNWSDIERNRAQGKISGILTLEDGRAVDGSLEKLERFYETGVRLISLTWNGANCFGAPNSFDPQVMAQGLTDFGKDAVVRMNELGMLVDVSHLSDGGFWDVAKLAKRPFVASHSNCRALNPHPRSMTDEMIRTLSDSGGIMGVNFYAPFLTADISCTESRTEDVVRHLRHMIQVGGEDCPALGSDLDGIDGETELGSADRMPQLFEALKRAGFTQKQIEKIAWKNAARVLRELG